jgi:hypothetical protein
MSHGLHPWLLKGNSFGVCCEKIVFLFYHFLLGAVGGKPLLNFCSGYPFQSFCSCLTKRISTSIPQPFISISFLIFYCAIDYVLHSPWVAPIVTQIEPFQGSSQSQLIRRIYLPSNLLINLIIGLQVPSPLERGWGEVSPLHLAIGLRDFFPPSGEIEGAFKTTHPAPHPHLNSQMQILLLFHISFRQQVFLVTTWHLQ